MAEQTFRSPGFYESEIDAGNSAATPTGTPAGVVGTSDKGPAFVPITVGSFSDFKAKFGGLNPKKYGPYAVKSFLDSKNACTFVRVLGAGANNLESEITTTELTGKVKNAGFVIAGTAANAGVGGTDGRYKGAVQLLTARHTLQTNEAFGIPMFSDSDAYLGASSVHLVRAMVLLASGTRMMVVNGDEPVTGVFGSLVPDDYATVASGKFKLILSSTDGTAFGVADGLSGLKVYTASLDPSSTDYIGKLLNSDPDRFATDQHLLYADFAVDNEVATATAVGVASGSSNTSQTSGDTSLAFREAFGRFDTRYTTPRTTMFISQPFGKVEYDLFYFETLDDGEYANTLYKVSISNVRASSDPSSPWGTFQVLIRSFDDTDANPKVLERFPNLTLDPNSDRYIAKVIGDREVSYNFDATDIAERRLVVSGKYKNASRYCRVIVSDAVRDGLVPQNVLPFGFRGIPVLKTNDNLTDVGSSNPRRLGMSFGLNVTSSLSGSIVPPVPFRLKVTKGDVGTSGFTGNPGATEIVNASYYWGVKFERNTTPLNPNPATEKNTLIGSFAKFLGISKLDTLLTGSGADTQNNNKFTLANVAFLQQAVSELTGSPVQHMRDVAYIRNARPDPTSYTVNDGVITRRITFATLAAQTSSVEFNRFTAYAKFTNFFYGGFDGVNILDRNARRMNDKASSFSSYGGAESSYVSPGLSSNVGGAGVSNNVVYSYKIAATIMTDPMTVNTNILALPGIRESYITDYVAERAKEYGLALYVLDIPSYDEDNNRLYDDSVARPSVDKTAKNFESRAIDNSYLTTYWPDVSLDDTDNKRRVTTPASVAALAALGFNDKVGYPWFAPAGFNRAALDFVKNVGVRLSNSDRDRLQDARINPIASFPKEGFVIYGQKTLQQMRSALDRVNVRRLVLEVKRLVVERARKLVFENGLPEERDNFVKDVTTQLGLIQTQAGLESFSVTMDDTNNTQADLDDHRVNGSIVLVPTKTIEFISIDFVIANGQVTFV
jgi:hypothetical protein